MNLIKKVKNSSTLDYIVAPAASILGAGIIFIFNIYSRSQILPEQYGFYSTAALLTTYASYAQLGVLNSYSRDYPRILGENDKNAASHLRNVTFTFVLCLYSLLCVFLIIATSIIGAGGKFPAELRFGLSANSVLVFFIIMVTFVENSLRSERRFKWVSLNNIAKAVAILAFGFFMVKYYGYRGLYVTQIIGALVPILMNIGYFSKIRIAFDKRLVATSIMSGLPLLVNSLIWMFMTTIDKWLIIGFMTSKEQGLYSIGTIAFSTIILIPASIAQIFYVKMSNKYGENHSVDTLSEYANKYSRWLSIISSFITVVTYALLPVLVRWFMPQYEGGVIAGKILIIGVSLYSTSLLFANILTILKENMKLVRNSIILCALNAIMSTTLVAFVQCNIIYVAIGTSVSYAIYSLLMLITASKTIHIDIIDTLKNSWLPAIIIGMAAIIINEIITLPWFSLIVTLVYAVIVSCVYLRKDLRLLLKNK